MGKMPEAQNFLIPPRIFEYNYFKNSSKRALSSIREILFKPENLSWRFAKPYNFAQFASVNNLFFLQYPRNLKIVSCLFAAVVSAFFFQRYTVFLQL